MGGSGPPSAVLGAFPDALWKHHRTGKSRGMAVGCPASGSGWFPLLHPCLVLGFNSPAHFLPRLVPLTGLCLLGVRTLMLSHHPVGLLLPPSTSHSQSSHLCTFAWGQRQGWWGAGALVVEGLL